MIQDILKLVNDHYVKIDHIYRTINLGYANGWTYNTSEIYKALKQHAVPNHSSSQTVGRCVTEYTFVIDDDVDRYVVTYRVDSGD